ncbi:hypothetical protein RRG08_029201 [Elysia crispata]|uniref:Uncharacterized protein n=1 Tax=Elysia crispata TaxID=231223 RepID=A0AAE1AK98_9GAST|nr:hypothetical protein RRG08_029201 [Elysia crispata]
MQFQAAFQISRKPCSGGGEAEMLRPISSTYIGIARKEEEYFLHISARMLQGTASRPLTLHGQIDQVVDYGECWKADCLVQHSAGTVDHNKLTTHYPSESLEGDTRPPQARYRAKRLRYNYILSAWPRLGSVPLLTEYVRT